MKTDDIYRSWDVLLIAGNSGSGKTTLLGEGAADDDDVRLRKTSRVVKGWLAEQGREQGWEA